MRGVVPVAFLVLLVPLLAGCTGKAAPEEPTEIVVKSKPLEVHSDDNSTETETESATKEPGQILGVVVDAAIRPILHAKVKIPGLDLQDEVDRQGVFAFADMLPSAYFVVAEAAGYRKAETTVEVQEGKAVRIRFVLDAIPPPDPYHQTVPFKGYADTSGAGLVGSFYCSNCNFPFVTDPQARAYVVEAVMDPYEWTGTASGNNSFDMYLTEGGGYSTGVSGSGGNPFLQVITADQLSNDTQYRMELTPNAFPLPESSKSFDVYITTWYNSVPPQGWSFVNGDT